MFKILICAFRYCKPLDFTKTLGCVILDLILNPLSWVPNLWFIIIQNVATKSKALSISNINKLQKKINLLNMAIQ